MPSDFFILLGIRLLLIVLQLLLLLLLLFLKLLIIALLDSIAIDKNQDWNISEWTHYRGALINIYKNFWKWVKQNSDFKFKNNPFMQMQVPQWVNNSQPAAQSVHGALVRHIPEICDQNPMYFRYLDGICILWDHGETQFQTFFDF